jgi:hypothetical protein
MLSYENPSGDFQGITYDTPLFRKTLKSRRSFYDPAAFKATLYRESGIIYAGSAWKSGYDSVQYPSS